MDVLNQLLQLATQYFPAQAAFVAAHPAFVAAGAFIVLAALDAALGGVLAARGGHFNRDQFNLEDKFVRGEVIAAGALLFAAAQVHGLTSGLFTSAATAILVPRVYALLLDVRDKLAELLGLLP